MNFEITKYCLERSYEKEEEYQKLIFLRNSDHAL